MANSSQIVAGLPVSKTLVDRDDETFTEHRAVWLLFGAPVGVTNCLALSVQEGGQARTRGEGGYGLVAEAIR